MISTSARSPARTSTTRRSAISVGASGRVTVTRSCVGTDAMANVPSSAVYVIC
jgi:hypothetical protein